MVLLPGEDRIFDVSNLFRSADRRINLDQERERERDREISLFVRRIVITRNRRGEDSRRSARIRVVNRRREPWCRIFTLSAGINVSFPAPHPHKPVVLHSGPYIPLGRETWPGELLFFQSSRNELQRGGNPRFFAFN